MRTSWLQFAAVLMYGIVMVNGRYAVPRAVTTGVTEFVTTTSSATGITSSSASIQTTAIIANSSSTTTSSSSTSLPTIVAIPGNSTADGTSLEDTTLVPVITPALSIAGVLLMISGVIYAAIGIKNERILVFLSVAYLTALAITVLELFLVNVPISSAVQGGYFVGVAVPALLTGALSLFFKDMLQGMAAALGGFTLAMFILVMHDDGVLKSTIARAIFIACWTTVCFGLQFIPKLRPYILIGATSLAGATSIVLGIDCFSLAGLKEFWVYIWALNNHYFPDTGFSYKVSRGMIVEIVAIFILTCFGILSQVRIWKVLKTKIAAHDEAKHEESRQRDDYEAQLGRIIAENEAGERLEWERAYTEQKALRHSVYGLGSQSKHTNSFTTGSDRTDSIKNSKQGSCQQDNTEEPTRLARPQPAHLQDQGDAITPVDSDFSNPFTSSMASSRTSISQRTDSDVDYTSKEPLPSSGLRTTHDIAGEPHHEEQQAQYAEMRKSTDGRTRSPTPSKTLFKGVSDKLRRLSVMSFSTVHAVVDEDEDIGDRWFQLETPDMGSPLDARSLHEEHLEEKSVENTSTQQHSRSKSLGLAMTVQKVSSTFSVDNAHSRSKSDFTKAHIAAELPGQDSTSDRFKPLKILPGDVSLQQQPLPTKNQSESAANHATDLSKMDQTLKAPTEDSMIEMQTMSAQRPPLVVQQYRTSEWAKHLDEGSKPDLEKQIVLTSCNELVATPDEIDLSRGLTMPEPIYTRSAAKPNNSTHTTASVKNTAPTRISATPARVLSDAQQPFSKRMSHPAILAQNTISLPRHSDSKQNLKRQIQASHLNKRMSVLASPIDEDAVASFPEAAMPEVRRRPKRASLPVRSQTEPTLIETIEKRQSRTSLRDVAGLSPKSGLTNEDEPLSVRRDQLRRMSAELLDRNRISQPPAAQVESSRRLSGLNPAAIARTKSPQIPAHTLHRASMLAEWRRSNSMDQPNKATNPSTVRTSSYTSADEGPPPDRQEARRSTSYNSPGIGSQDMVRSSIYGPDLNMISSAPSPKRMSRPISNQSLHEAHRDALRKMQAGANRALRTSGQY